MESARVRSFTNRYAPVELVGTHKKARKSATPSPTLKKPVKVAAGKKGPKGKGGKAKASPKPSKKSVGKVKTIKKQAKGAAGKAGKAGKAAKGASPVRKHQIPDLEDLVYTEAALEAATESMLESDSFLSKSACMKQFCLPDYVVETLKFTARGEGTRTTVAVMDVQAAARAHHSEEDTEKFLAHALSRRKEFKEE